MVMARNGVDYETIKQTAVKLLSQGIAPSVQKIREELGTGSNTTIAEHLKVWRDEYAKKTIHHLPANMPKELISAFEVLWQTAMEHAQNHLAEYKKAIECEREAVAQKENEANKAIGDFQLKLEELTRALGQENTNNQKLSIELAVANDRLLKQDEILTTEKSQYEDRLKRVYEEKDNIVKENHNLQNEINKLQEKLTFQAEQHQIRLTELTSLHEQSETRWLKLIDQAKQETKDTIKKYQTLNKDSHDQIKKLNLILSNLQQNQFDKEAQLNAAQERIVQLRQEIKFIETEYINARAMIIKFEEERKAAANHHSSKRHKKEYQAKEEA